MSIQSNIDSQLDVYQKLFFQHQNTRRERQTELLDDVQRLNDDVKTSLADDKRAYKNAKDEFHRKFNLLKRVFLPAVSRYNSSSVRPLKDLYHRRIDLTTKVNDLVNETAMETAPMEIRTRWNGSIAVVYNPITGRAEWRENWHGGVHGVFNPVTRTVEWEEAFQSGVYGVFNPKLNIVEWKKYFKGGVHGVYNRSSDKIEWHMSFTSGIGGVYNPLTGEIEWKTLFRGGVVGYFDYESQTVKWIEKWHHGVALILWDSTIGCYLTSASCGWYGEE